jgi:NitT/TauT family transport system ATP-binding protein
MLMDEPFAAPDAQSRVMMQELLLPLARGATTILFVTHDVDEAIFPATVAIMTARPGRLKQNSRYHCHASNSKWPQTIPLSG